MSHQAQNLTGNNFSGTNKNHDKLNASLPNDDQLISCEICLQAIPLSESDTSEVDEYVAYFCGLECYDVWRNQKST